MVLFKKSLKPASLATLLALATLAPTNSSGNPQAGGSHKIRASVPMACWVQIDAAVVAQTGRTGNIVEACNTPSGFTLTASYRPLGPNERAEFTYGNQQFVLSPSGQQILRAREGATVRTVPYQFGTVQVDEPLVLSIVIQPI